MTISTLTSLNILPPDILKLLSLLLLSTPLSIPIPHLTKHPTILHIYSILISFGFLIGVFNLRFGTIQLLIASITTYLTCHFLIALPSIKNKTFKPNSSTPWWIFAGLLAHLTINHSKRIFLNVSYDTVEITGAQMVLVMKLSTFAWNVYDGHRPIEDLDEYQKSTAIRKMPGLLEFIAYCFFFPSLLVGPAIPFAHYKAFADRKLWGSNANVPKGRLNHALKSLAIGFAFAGLVGTYGSKWSYDRMLEDSFLEKNWLQRLLHVQLSGFMSRGKYYLVWSLSQAAFTTSGCGYDPITKSWLAGQNIDILAIELAQNYKAVFDHWNMKTNLWLRECVYKRVPLKKEGDKPGFKATLATFIASAAWHGPLPAYFLVFISGAFVQALGRSFRRSIRPFFINTSLKPVYDIIGLLAVQTNLNYIVIPFLLLDVRNSIEAWNRLGWYGHLATGLPIILLWAGGEKASRAKISKSSTNTTTTTHQQPKAEMKTIATATTVVIGKKGNAVVETTSFGEVEEVLMQLKAKKE
ncbi:hypothetical protein CROQUDRAFT_86539 [Cronartium quercuum f. sp. fusiforme G11]|uniref:Uncharacterized protein n=1 Tax=Cronartium quercuum f. sp. fusiforme G11 TaxID=708437 RepID=A0A9P6NTV3_9BASI|nr:hypothetical protein CROQUDRAFT_86539 [Cronartium quercuum f. sp. fusiforme G11]